ncbi:hypothetical protein DPEC_G00313290 [Dallia pectoralis]|uniref:Uncharacterized protein n=1 Tax=Dallia pectoralis TaxID=75939 RepID=A0ACC2FC06_DALPE|nr:hypothetical protein DPEC_G00313290 [Dallia pectoralis]
MVHLSLWALLKSTEQSSGELRLGPRRILSPRCDLAVFRGQQEEPHGVPHCLLSPCCAENPTSSRDGAGASTGSREGGRQNCGGGRLVPKCSATVGLAAQSLKSPETKPQRPADPVKARPNDAPAAAPHRHTELQQRPCVIRLGLHHSSNTHNGSQGPATGGLGGGGWRRETRARGGKRESL